jgi:hypothetical protein
MRRNTALAAVIATLSLTAAALAQPAAPVHGPLRGSLH